jgi:ABC-type phosphate/phosphonate transport system ATPase subunit
MTTVVFYLFRRRSQSRANSIVFVGASGAGKTAILSTVRVVSFYVGTFDSDARRSWHTAIRFQATHRYKQIHAFIR